MPEPRGETGEADGLLGRTRAAAGDSDERSRDRCLQQSVFHSGNAERAKLRGVSRFWYVRAANVWRLVAVSLEAPHQVLQVRIQLCPVGGHTYAVYPGRSPLVYPLPRLTQNSSVMWCASAVKRNSESAAASKAMRSSTGVIVALPLCGDGVSLEPLKPSIPFPLYAALPRSEYCGGGPTPPRAPAALRQCLSGVASALARDAWRPPEFRPDSLAAMPRS